MEFGLVHYNAPGTVLEEFLDYTTDAGFSYMELLREDVWPVDDVAPEKRAQQVRTALDARKLRVSALQAGSEFIVLKDDGLAGEVERIRRIAQLGKILGTDILRIEAGWPPARVPDKVWMDAMIEGMKRCLDFAEDLDIKFALDNHGVTTNRAELQLEVLARVDSTRMGINLDTMNYRWFGHDLETVDRYYDMVAPHVFHVHLKDGRGSLAEYQGAALGEGEIHLECAIQSLKRVDYRGAWCAEYEGPKAESADGYRKCLAWMRAHVTDESSSVRISDGSNLTM